ncbi:MAG: T9SS type A sorting domain-containing protein [Bacteroidetes bacterium]|jgi:hypothetical protein|nr:T9SS type A sorting domain-containing protein [Bacteroidota bacterium]
MKKQLLQLAILAFALNATAQVTLTYETHSLQPETKNPMILTNYHNPGDAGENVVWDLTSLEANKEFTGILNHNETEFAPLSNTELIEGTNKFYFDVNNNRILELAVSTNQGRYQIEYAEPPVKMVYPFEYGDIEQGNFKGTYTSGSAKGTIAGTYSIEADAYGSLKLPDLNIDNVIRIKSVKDYVKKIGESETHILTETYRWYAEAERYPVAVMIKTTIGYDDGRTGNPRYQAAYKKEIQRPVTKAAKTAQSTKIEAYPNPVSDQLMINYNVTESSRVNISLVDMSGKLVKNIVAEHQEANNYNVNVSVDELRLQPASYILKTEIGDYSNSEVIVVE